MSVTGEKIKERRKQLGISADMLATYLGVSRSTIFRYENGGIEKIPANLLPDIARYLQTSEAFLMGWKDDAAPAVTNLYPLELKSFPMTAQIADEKFGTHGELKTPAISGSSIAADFCMRVSGNSMSGARILDGDIVFVKRQNMVNNGDIAAVVINDENKAILMRFFYYTEKQMVVLKAENPS